MKLPEDWSNYSQLDKAKWFSKFVLVYQREGEIKGLPMDCALEIKEAYEQFIKEGGYGN